MELVPSVVQVGHYSANLGQKRPHGDPLGVAGGKLRHLESLEHASEMGNCKAGLGSPKDERKTPVFTLAHFQCPSMPALIVGTLDDEGTEPAVSVAGAMAEYQQPTYMDVDPVVAVYSPASPVHHSQPTSHMNQALMQFLFNERSSHDARPFTWSNTLRRLMGSPARSVRVPSPMTTLEEHPDKILELCRAELMFTRLPDYMRRVQRGVEEWMRENIVQWVFEVCEWMSLGPQTVACTIMNMDRVLSTVCLKPEKLQLLAAGSLLLASQMYEKNTAIEAEVFSSLTDFHFSASEVTTMRNFLCRELKGRAYVVTPHQFVTAFFTAFPMHKLPQVQRHAEFFTDLSFVDYDFVSFRPSSIALAAGICSFQQMNIEHCVWSRAAMSIHAFDAGEVWRAVEMLTCLYFEAFPEAHARAQARASRLQQQQQRMRRRAQARARQRHQDGVAGDIPPAAVNHGDGAQAAAQVAAPRHPRRPLTVAVPATPAIDQTRNPNAPPAPAPPPPPAPRALQATSVATAPLQPGTAAVVDLPSRRTTRQDSLRRRPASVNGLTMQPQPRGASPVSPVSPEIRLVPFSANLPQQNVVVSRPSARHRPGAAMPSPALAPAAPAAAPAAVPGRGGPVTPAAPTRSRRLEEPEASSRPRQRRRTCPASPPTLNTMLVVVDNDETQPESSQAETSGARSPSSARSVTSPSASPVMDVEAPVNNLASFAEVAEVHSASASPPPPPPRSLSRSEAVAMDDETEQDDPVVVHAVDPPRAAAAAAAAAAAPQSSSQPSRRDAAMPPALDSDKDRGPVRRPEHFSTHPRSMTSCHYACQKAHKRKDRVAVAGVPSPYTMLTRPVAQY